MQTVTLADITARLRELPVDTLVVVVDFVSYLSERELSEVLRDTGVGTAEFMFASEAVLGRDWNRPEEDAAWASL